MFLPLMGISQNVDLTDGNWTFTPNVTVQGKLNFNEIQDTALQKALDSVLVSEAFQYAYLPGDSTPTTTCTDAGTFYFVQGNYFNPYSNQMGFVGDTLRYEGADTIIAKVYYTVKVSSNKNATITFGFAEDGTAHKQSTKSVTLSVGEAKSVTHFFYKEYVTNEKIKFVVKSDAGATTVTITESALDFEERWTKGVL